MFLPFTNLSHIRTRFAPSPTGYVHVGSLRTALYSFLFAKQNKGDFIVRIEDTDQTREVEGAVDNLLKALAWSGLAPDEGVYLNNEGKVAEKGNFGPYKQSQRTEIYWKYAQKLVDAGQAYHCFCSPERLEKLRQEQEARKKPTKYDGCCRALSYGEIQTRLAKGEKYVIRMKVPVGKEIVFADLIHGEIKFRSDEIDDQILLKSDGFPTYHLANVVDDHLMKISHVIRGEEWLSSTPKHILLYNYFNWEIPAYAHLPLLLNPDKSKMSKRQGDVAVEDYRAQGYLPETLVNFVALLGWNPGTEKEIFSLPELIREFDFKKVNKAGAVFDSRKLNWMNGEYLKKMDFAEFVKVVEPFLSGAMKENKNQLEKILRLEKNRISRLAEIGQGIEYLFNDKLEYAPQLLIWKKSNQEKTLNNLRLLTAELEKYEAGEWTKEKLEKNIIAFITNSNLSNGDVLWPMRVALTSAEKSPTPFEIAEILGRDKTLARLNNAISKLSSNS